MDPRTSVNQSALIPAYTRCRDGTFIEEYYEPNQHKRIGRFTITLIAADKDSFERLVRGVRQELQKLESQESPMVTRQLTDISAQLITQDAFKPQMIMLEFVFGYRFTGDADYQSFARTHQSISELLSESYLGAVQSLYPNATAAAIEWEKLKQAYLSPMQNRLATQKRLFLGL